MGAMFRSEEMALCQMFIQPEAAYTSVSELGETGAVQFRDLNSEVNAFQRKFVSEVRRCDEMERKLRYVEAEVKKDNVKIPDIRDELPRAPNPREIIDLEAHLEKTESEILELSQNAVNLKSNYLELTELKHVLERTQGFFFEQEGAVNLDATRNNLIIDDHTNVQARGRLGFVAGVIQREKVPGFERMLWRISRGNVFLRQVELEKPLEDPATGNEIYKTVFAAFFQGEQLKTRIKKVCTGYHASLYPCPSAADEREEMVKGVRTRLEDLNMVLNQTQDHRSRVLSTVAKELPRWRIMVKKMKAIYHTLNLFNMDVTKKCLIGECWVPVLDLPIVQKALSDGSAAVGSTIPSFLNVIETSEQPPTFNRTNKFTRGFQNLIDSYGIASYREANPALYTIITFPFLFGIMFGDLGHGLIMALFGFWMVSGEKKLGAKRSSNEIWNIFFGGRYIIFLMGLFSMYTGFVYNDVFSKSMNIFGSSWSIGYNTTTIMSNKDLTLNPGSSDLDDNVYPIGLDPVWQLASNKIIFLNSYKMKLSIIFGVVHMIFGVCMSVVNHNFFKKRISIVLEFLPQIIFLVLLFAYMVFMMFMKWIQYTAKTDYQPNTPGCAPSVLIMFINMMLFKRTPPLHGCDEYMYSFQGSLQRTFVFIALICVPWMLLGKPLYIMFNKKKMAAAHHNGDINQQTETALETAESAKSSGHGGHEDEPISEVFIHQAIHTIEYVLSTVSHTASYLRLWALSLAHAQLSEVLWNMVLSMGLRQSSYKGAIMLYFVFGAWALFTLAILVMMEGLSAFLHTLRLHWVEFMSKFYEGLGYVFQPFSFQQILDADEDVE
ncbi:V-type proton ATPase 116 kDa subunit a 1 isoform X2 [Aedes albopictus]|nr:V-type proton ATPase 116 kDa subunit a-like isoform X2 [Aedes albopictus]XP_019546779.1 V-type proton ATPase 116 kDa subunit a-like isoform X2 [Aedes albopictus]XP_029729100.1 V-type proton ATPase 116 kDa subunit a-like isoform X2 [Aedes albopictus]XP_029729101.1 V-type proton ATPase 116 kDa subunit a-like isoform X2 [Aedes albopictus]XP_029729102.1 V-type proton ATPase 116 kDa subunit a-like isoform X2 [Aedes albopictus]